MRKTKVFHFIFIFLLAIILVACKKEEDIVEDIEINLETSSVALNVDEEHKIVYTINDDEGVTFTSSNETIASVSETGMVRALQGGEVTITIQSKADGTKKVTFTVIITASETITLAEGMEVDLGYKVADGYRFESERDYVASVTDEGILTAHLQSSVVVKVFKDENLIKAINLTIQNRVRTITLTGPEKIRFEDEVKLEVAILPFDAYQETEFVIEDESILTVDESGVVTPLKAGTTKVAVKSLQDDNTKSEIIIDIKPTIIVSNQTSNLKLGNYTFEIGKTMFDSIEEAVENANEDTKVLLHNLDINSTVTLNKKILIAGIDSTIRSTINIDTTDLVELVNLSFANDAKISSDKDVNVLIDNIVASNISSDNFIELSNVTSFKLTNSKVNSNTGNGIKISNIASSDNIYLENNEFEVLDDAIILESNSKLEDDAKIALYYNKIDAKTAFNISIDEINVNTNAHLYARFNEVTNYDIAVINSGAKVFEYTFNYWGEFDLDNFENVDEKMLLGHYSSSDDIMSKIRYNPEIPIIATLTNKPEQIELGDAFELDILTIPYTADETRFYISLDNTQIVDLENGNILKPFRSGLLGVSIGSYSDLSKAIKHEIDLTTEPGLTFELSNQSAGLEIGDTFVVTATPFPYNLAEERVTYTSSNTGVATVDSVGNVAVLGEGEFEIIASLVSDPTVEQRIPLKSYGTLDENDVLDFYTMNQINYSKVYDMTFHGTSIATAKLSEPVTRLLADDVERFEDIIPVTPGFRPGVKFNDNIPEEFKFNDDNVVWVVVHDTGNSNTGAGARMHANYLMNQVLNNGRQASWHYTVDPTEIFQHMPLDEVAYHAGDGSSVPGPDKTSPALGGGNRNGIGIEMSIQRDGDQFKTWQNTARLVAELLDIYNLPLTHQSFHYDHSGKECPQTLRRAGLVWLFHSYVENELHLRNTIEEGTEVKMVSHSPNILSDTGQIVNIPNHSTIVEYDIIVTQNGVETIQTFKTLVEGLFK